MTCESDSRGRAATYSDPLDRLSGLSAAFSAQTGIDCRLDVRREHTRLDPMAADVLHRAIRELLILHKRTRAPQIVVASERRADGSVAFHVRSVEGDGKVRQASALDAVALWDVDQSLRAVGAYLEFGGHPSVVFPGQLVIPR